MNQRIKDLEVKRLEAGKALTVIEGALYAEWLAYYAEMHGIAIGCIVNITGTKSACYQVTDIDTEHGEQKPRIIGRARFKDGSFAEIKRHLGSDWEIVR